MDISEFTEKQLELLDIELKEDLATTREALASLAPATLARNGLAVLHLLPASQRTGLGGKTILELEPDPSIGTGSLAAGSSSGIRSGDIVRIEEQPGGSATKWTKREIKAGGVEGVVQFVKENSIGVVIGSENDEDALDKLVAGGKRLWVVKAGSEVVYRRMEKAVRRLGEDAKNSRKMTLARILFGLSAPDPLQEVSIDFFDENLNESQKGAVRFAVGSPQLALVHGPPGTGKTQTLIEIIRQFTEKQDLKVLVCAPSNIAVDNIVLRLPPALPAIRIGHPARLLPKVLARSLDILTKTSEEAQIVSDVRKDVDEKLGSLMAKGRNRLKGKARGEGWKDLRELRQEFRQREAKCIKQLVGRSKVVLSTLHGAGARQLYGENFDVVIIDEASQALEAQCWIPLLNAKKLVLAGDHLQLPPTVKSETNHSSKGQKKAKTASTEGSKSTVPNSLTTTLFSRLLDMYGPSIKRLLTTQYRMHQTIMAFPSLSLYESKLIAAPSVATHLLIDLPHVSSTDDTKEPVVFYDTQGGDFPESDEVNEGNSKSLVLTESKSNPNEAALCKFHLKALLDAGVKEEEICIISGYSAQVALLVSSIRSEYPGVEIGTVDGFQGREKEAVILTLVRSNDKREIGFLKEKRRLNVAMTRARRHLCVIGDGETLSKEKGFVKDWVDWLEQNADVRFPDLAEVHGS